MQAMKQRSLRSCPIGRNFLEVEVTGSMVEREKRVSDSIMEINTDQDLMTDLGVPFWLVRVASVLLEG